MKKFGVFAAIAAAGLLAAGESVVLPWSEGLNRAERFEKNSSGTMTVRADEKEKAVRFDVEFKPGTDFWCYPRLRLQPEETLANAEAIRFEFKAEQKDPAAGYRNAYVMFENGMPYFKLPEPKQEYRSVTINLAEAVKDPAAVRQLRIGMNPRSEKLTFFIRNIEVLGDPAKQPPCDTADAVVAHAPGAAFIQGEPLRFTLKPYAAAAPGWTLRNWKGELLRTGTWPQDGTRELRLASLPNGYYTLELASDRQAFDGFRSFAVVPDPAEKPRNPEMYFAMDSAQSWLARPDRANSRHPGDAYETVSEVARRAGLKMVRERMSWSECEPSPGKFDWKQYMANAALLAERGVRVSGMYHNAPPWAKTNTTHLPGDLVATYNFAKKLAETFRGKMAVWEFWNEQDIGFAPEGAWDYASALKAASLGFKAGDPELPVAIGGYAQTALPPYADVVMENGAGGYFDIFNIHTYATLKEYPSLLGKIRAHLARHGVSDRPLWFTENGCRMEGSGTKDSHMAGIRAHSPEQEMVVAEFLPKMMVIMQSLGVDRDFFFVLPPYNEQGGNKDWGLMRRDYTVKPGFAAFATLTDKLGNAVYEGTLELGKGIRGFVYRNPDGGKSLVYWSESELDTDGGIPAVNLKDPLARGFSLKLDGSFSGVDAFGTPFTAASRNGKLDLTATRMPSILTGIPVLEPTERFAAGKKGRADAGRFDRTIVFRTELSDDFGLLGDKSAVDVKKEDAALKLQVFNLSDTVKTGRVTVSGGSAAGLPEEVTVPAFGKVELPLTVTPALDETFQGAIRISGMFGGKEATPAVIPCRMLSRMRQQSRKEELPGMMDPVNWRRNSSGKMTISFDKAENALRFRTEFPDGVDRWTYPEYVLQLPQESLKGAIGMSFEVKALPAAKVKQMLVMAVMGEQKEGGESVNLAVAAPAEKWEERFVQFSGGLDPDRIRQLRIGLNSNTDDITYLIRNVKILYAQ
ncbi:MAG: hypothetical protein HPZ91_05860 [Lentisphaeria bacterium]|nr:hypothetical protein [Lentisphaeria bacterium]